MWFDPDRNILCRISLALLFFFAGGAYMYVWCELYRPRWYNGPLRNRYGLLIPSGTADVLAD